MATETVITTCKNITFHDFMTEENMTEEAVRVEQEPMGG